MTKEFCRYVFKLQVSRYALFEIFLLLSFTITLLCSFMLVFSFMYVITYFTLLVSVTNQHGLFVNTEDISVSK